MRLVVAKLDDVCVAVAAGASEQRAELLANAADIKTISNEFEQGCAVDCLRELNGALKAVEKSRTEVKAPVLDVGRKIDGLAKDFTAPISAEVARLNKLVTAYQVAERKKAEESERQRQAELARIEAERIKAQREEQARAEAARQAELAAQRAKEERETAFTRKEAAEAQRQQRAAEEQRRQAELAAEAARKQQAELEAQRAVAQQAVAKPVAKPSGLVVKTVWKFEVLDAWALANTNRELVRIEPNAAAINEAVRGGMRECPGLRIYSETVSGVRS